MNIDLHIHSTASDGTFTPSEIVVKAAELGLGAISITDHDTVDGVREVLNAGVSPRLGFLPGLEISARPPSRFPSSGSFHILGYGMNIDDPELNDALMGLKDSREQRNPRIVALLRELGLELSMEEVAVEAGEGLMGRPHMAKVMVQKGYVGSIEEAFDRYLGSGKPAYVEKQRMDCEEALHVIRKAGGIPVLAHPMTLGIRDEGTLDALVRWMKRAGLGGIEAYYSRHSAHLTGLYKKVAEREELLITGGSDFHGALKDKISMGSGLGDLHVPYELYEKLVLELDYEQ